MFSVHAGSIGMSPIISWGASVGDILGQANERYTVARGRQCREGLIGVTWGKLLRVMNMWHFVLIETLVTSQHKQWILMRTIFTRRFWKLSISGWNAKGTYWLYHKCREQSPEKDEGMSTERTWEICLEDWRQQKLHASTSYLTKMFSTGHRVLIRKLLSLSTWWNQVQRADGTSQLSHNEWRQQINRREKLIIHIVSSWHYRHTVHLSLASYRYRDL